MTDREIMQQALDALKYHTEHTYPFHLTNVAMEALRQELAQPKQEPVAVWELTEGGWDTIADADWMETLPIGTKLYTTPHSATHSADSAETFGKPDIGLPDPCPQCRKGGVCRTPKCGRLQLPAEHPYRNQALAQPEQEPVHFLANGVRYKVTHQGYYGRSIVGLPENLNGQWVALVEATDSKHLNCIAPQESTKPEQKPIAWITRRTGDGGVVLSGYETCEPTDYDAIPVYTAPPKREWVGLTDHQIALIHDDFPHPQGFARAIEAKSRELNR